jgi:hypothetical protein
LQHEGGGAKAAFGLVWCAAMSFAAVSLAAVSLPAVPFVRRLAPCIALVLVACGGSPPPEERSGDTLFTTAGGDSSGGEAVAVGPAPLPLPTPPIARAALDPQLQSYWTRAEEIIAAAPPAAASDPDAGPEAREALTDWLSARAESVREMIRGLEAFTGVALYERAIAAALLGYVIEDTMADTRGAPVPADIASDPELLTAYRDALDDVLVPFAEQASMGYQICTEALDRHGEPAWGEWRAFCFERAEELAEIYGAAEEAPAPEAGE